MTPRVPRVTPDRTIGDVRRMLEREAAQIDTLHYVYVVDDSGIFTGVISIRDVFRQPPDTPVGEICRRENLHVVHPAAHQERAAYLALRNGIKAVPVVDHDHVFLGAIPSDALLRILYKETHEDLLRRSGVHAGHPLFDNVLTLPLKTSILHRLPWLLLGLLGGLFAAQVVGFFEDTLSKNLILAAFIPLIVYMSDAVGTQTEAFIIRDLAMDRKIPFLRYFTRQFLVTVVIAALCAAALFLLCILFYRDMAVGVTVGAALFAAVVSSLCTGLLIPWLLSRFHADPANASGPVATMIQDILSLCIYFTIASAVL